MYNTAERWRIRLIHQKMNFIFIFLLFVFFSFTIVTCSSYDLGQVVFVILSQSNWFHAQQGDIQRERIKTQLSEDGVKLPRIFDLHNDWTMDGKTRKRSLLYQSKGNLPTS